MKHIRQIASIGMLFCLGFAQPDKNMIQQKHHTNYHAEITDNRDKTYQVENVSLAGKLRGIKFYELPIDTAHDPQENVTFFDLDQIYSIEPARGEKCSLSPRFNNRTYSEIIVTLADPGRTAHRYLIENSQKIMCDRITDVGPLEKEISFTGIKKITIISRTERSYTQLHPQNCPAKKEK